MSFAKVRQVSNERLSEVFLYLNHINSLETDIALPVSQEVKVMKGLFFVILYGALEKSINEVMQHLLLKIKSLQPTNEHVTLPFNVVSQVRRWKSIKDTGYKKSLTQIRELFLSIEDKNPVDIEATMFAQTLQNIWGNTIDEIIGALGMTTFSITVSDRTLIDELVEKRNAVAHGREAASTVGERYKVNELRIKFGQTQTFITNLIDSLEKYYDDREFIRLQNHTCYI